MSATVSTSLIFQSATRLSTISTAGSAPAIASSATRGDARAGEVAGHDEGELGLHAGWTSRDSGIRSPSSTNISSVSTPKSGSSTPSRSCMGLRGEADLAADHPLAAAIRRSMLIVWIA